MFLDSSIPGDSSPNLPVLTRFQQHGSRSRSDVPPITAETVSWEAERAELQAVLQSHLFTRSPTLTHLLSYLCEKTFAGESAQIKEYSVGLDVFDRLDSFDQDTDSIVRVQANRLRKRLSDYYASEG